MMFSNSARWPPKAVACLFKCTLVVAYNEFGYYEALAITSYFFSQKKKDFCLTPMLKKFG